jgi:hypothetical protein
MTISLEEAIIITHKLSRQANFPDTDEGVKDLAKGLQRAVALGVSPDRLIEECKRSSPYCPTDWDLMQVARDLMPRETWQQPERGKCPHCSGAGWAESFWLVTQESPGNRASFKRRERISREVYEELSMPGKLDHAKQGTYAAVRRCQCGAVPAAAAEGVQ